MLDLDSLETLLSRWCVSSGQAVAEGPVPHMSSSESEWKTPSPSPPTARPTKRKRPTPSSCREEEASASPDLKRGGSKTLNMKRTPQPTLTQSRLTGMLQLQPPTASSTTAAIATPAPAQESGEPNPKPTTDSSAMDTSEPSNQRGVGAVQGTNAVAPTSGTLVTTDFLLQSLKANTDHIIKSFTASMGAISRRVEDNATRIDGNVSEIKRHEESLIAQKEDIIGIKARLCALERNPGTTALQKHRATLSADYLRARRAIRLWPIRGRTTNEMWGDVGEFIHDTLRISTDDARQEDIESIERTAGPGTSSVVDEVVVVFRDRRVRDAVMAGSVNLASCVDGQNRPTAGTRLEIPDELAETFRLLARFGTRLRARHGEGTKRHIKFDDFAGSLYTNVKLPGDTEWTRVSPQMARDDLECSIREENTMNQRRLAAKLIPGPRERLAVPMPNEGRGLLGQAPPPRAVPASAGGKRPRWSGPARQPPPL